MMPEIEFGADGVGWGIGRIIPETRLIDGNSNLAGGEQSIRKATAITFQVSAPYNEVWYVTPAASTRAAKLWPDMFMITHSQVTMRFNMLVLHGNVGETIRYNPPRGDPIAGWKERGHA